MEMKRELLTIAVQVKANLSEGGTLSLKLSGAHQTPEGEMVSVVMEDFPDDDQTKIHEALQHLLDQQAEQLRPMTDRAIAIRQQAGERNIQTFTVPGEEA